MQLLPYCHSVVDSWFTKEEDYLIHTEMGNNYVAKLHKRITSYDDPGTWVWVSSESGNIIPWYTITKYGVISP